MNGPVFEFSPDGRKINVAFGTDRRMQVIDIATGAITRGDYGEFPSQQRVATGGVATGGSAPTPCPGGGGCGQ